MRTRWQGGPALARAVRADDAVAGEYQSRCSCTEMTGKCSNVSVSEATQRQHA